MGSVGGGHLDLTSGQLSLIREGCARALRHALLHTLLELLKAVWKVSGRVLTRQDSAGGSGWGRPAPGPVAGTTVVFENGAQHFSLLLETLRNPTSCSEDKASHGS